MLILIVSLGILFGAVLFRFIWNETRMNRINHELLETILKQLDRTHTMGTLTTQEELDALLDTSHKEDKHSSTAYLKFNEDGVLERVQK